MMKSIGLSRLFIILLLASFTLFCLFYSYKVGGPNIKKEKRSLAVVNNDISKMTSDMDKLSQGLTQFEGQKQAFSNVQRFGFFDDQDRVKARQLIEAMQEESRLLSAVYSLGPAESLNEPRATDAGYDLLNTNIGFTIEAVEDIDVYKFIYLLNYGFPGQISIKSLSMSRDEEITQPLLRQIGTGQPTPLIRAELEVFWKSMVPEGQFNPDADENNRGGI